MKALLLLLLALPASAGDMAQNPSVDPSSAAATYVVKTGDTMSGALTMSGASANIVSGSSITTTGGLFGTSVRATQAGAPSVSPAGDFGTNSVASSIILRGGNAWGWETDNSGNAFMSNVSFPYPASGLRFDQQDGITVPKNIVGTSSITTTGGLFGASGVFGGSLSGITASDPVKVVATDGNAQGSGVFWGPNNISYGGRLTYDQNTGFLKIDNIHDSATARMDFRTRTGGAPVTAMSILGSGNVGIGTTSPLRKAHVDGTAAAPATNNSLVRIGSESLGAGLDIGQASASPYASWLQATNNAWGSQFPISLNPSGGNVGVGTNSPATTLDVNGSAQFGSGATKSTVTAGGVWTSATQPRVRLKTINAQGCQTGGFCSVYWDTEDEDVGGFWVVGSSDAITVPAGMGGYYLITAVVLYDATGTAGVGRYAALSLDGSGVNMPNVIVPGIGAANATGVNFSWGITLTAGQVIRIQGRHDIGSNLNLLGGCHLSMVKVW